MAGRPRQPRTPGPGAPRSSRKLRLSPSGGKAGAKGVRRSSRRPQAPPRRRLEPGSPPAPRPRPRDRRRKRTVSRADQPEKSAYDKMLNRVRHQLSRIRYDGEG